MTSSFLRLATALPIIITACTQPQPVPVEGTKQSDAEPLSKYTLDSNFVQKTAAVGHLEISYRDGTDRGCSAVVINPSYIITSYHCVPGLAYRNSTNEQGATDTTLYLDYYVDINSAKRVSVSPQPVVQDRTLDYAILALNTTLPEKYQSLRFSNTRPRLGDALRVIHHGAGLAKLITRSRCQVTKPPLRQYPNEADAPEFALFHRCDTSAGSSGGAILSDSDGTVIALHRGGRPQLGEADANDGVLIAAIENHLGQSLNRFSANQIALNDANSPADPSQPIPNEGGVGSESSPEATPNPQPPSSGAPDLETPAPGTAGDAPGGESVTPPTAPSLPRGSDGSQTAQQEHRQKDGTWQTEPGPKFENGYDAAELAAKYCTDSWGDCGYGDHKDVAPAGHDYQIAGLKICADDGQFYRVTHRGPGTFTYSLFADLNAQAQELTDRNSEAFLDSLENEPKAPIGRELQARLQGKQGRGFFRDSCQT